MTQQPLIEMHKETLGNGFIVSPLPGTELTWIMHRNALDGAEDVMQGQQQNQPQEPGFNKTQHHPKQLVDDPQHRNAMDKGPNQRGDNMNDEDGSEKEQDIGQQRRSHGSIPSE